VGGSFFVRLSPGPRRGTYLKSLSIPIPLPGFSRPGLPGDKWGICRKRILQERASVRLSGQALFCPSAGLHGSDFPNDPDMSCRRRAGYPGDVLGAAAYIRRFPLSR